VRDSCLERRDIEKLRCSLWMPRIWQGSLIQIQAPHMAPWTKHTNPCAAPLLTSPLYCIISAHLLVEELSQLRRQCRVAGPEVDLNFQIFAIRWIIRIKPSLIGGQLTAPQAAISRVDTILEIFQNIDEIQAQLSRSCFRTGSRLPNGLGAVLYLGSHRFSDGPHLGSG
jgi:hypothetical protein